MVASSPSIAGFTNLQCTDLNHHAADGKSQLETDEASNTPLHNVVLELVAENDSIFGKTVSIILLLEEHKSALADTTTDANGVGSPQPTLTRIDTA